MQAEILYNNFSLIAVGFFLERRMRRSKEYNTYENRIVVRKILFVCVIAWARGQLRINFTRIFKGSFGKTLKIQVKLILNCPRALAITCLSHKGQNFSGNCILAQCPGDEALSIPPQMSKQT